jgi:citrate synthase
MIILSVVVSIQMWISIRAFKPGMFPVLFAIGRTVGWIAQWQEMLMDNEQKIARPRQIYLGEGERDFVSIDRRG